MKKIFTILITTLVAFAVAFALTAGPNSPSSVTSPAPGVNWTTPGNAVSSNDSYATLTLSAGTSGRGLEAVSFGGFGVPDGATINGVLVEYEGHSTSSDGGDAYAVHLLDGSTPIGSDKTGTGTDLLGGTDAYVSLGGAADLWGATLTPTAVNASTFGVELAPALEDITGFNTWAISVDHVRITIYYTPSSSTKSPTGGVGYSGGGGFIF